MLDVEKCHRKIIELLKAERRRAGLRQNDLAARLDIPQSYVSRMEQGHRQVKLCEFFILARAIGFDGFQALRPIMNSRDCPRPLPPRGGGGRTSSARRPRRTQAAA